MANPSKCLKDVVDFGSCGSVTDPSDSLLRVSGERDRLFRALQNRYTDMYFLWYYGSVMRKEGIWGSKEMGVVIHGRIRMCYSLLAYMPVFTVSLVFS